MDKLAGSLSIAITLAAGLLFQSGRHASSTPQKSQASVERADNQPIMGDGPWIASCRYWAAVRKPDVSGARDGNKETQPTSAQDSDCGSTEEGWAWNIPSEGGTTADAEPLPAADITAMIAIVPDPVHSGLALDFDRTLETILLAGADNHYLSGYYWLPWQQQRSTGKGSDAGTSSSSYDAPRELQPGLIVLRYAPESNEWPHKNSEQREQTPSAGARQQYSWNSYRRVVYLFLVAETPALGINGEQLRNAMRYEAYLRNKHGAHLSIQRPGTRATKPADDVLSVIGPSYSGTAASLYAGLSAGLPELGNPTVSITGVTSTIVAAHELDPTAKGTYRSFGENTGFEQDRFLEALIRSGYDMSRVVVLSEAGTVFGSTTGEDPSGGHGRHDTCSAGQRGCYRPDDKPLDGAGTILNLRFPRELSVLRNATANETKSDNDAAPTPYLDFSLKGDAADDTVELFSNTQTPLSIEAQLMAIADQLKRARTQFVLISASNILDDLFLAQFLHRACPDARLVVSDGGDLLFEREGENASYVGSVSITPYLLSSLDFTQRTQWLHSDYHSNEIYNAASFAFHNSAVPWEPTLSGYLQHYSSGSDSNTQVRQIPLWASVVGSDGYYPLALLSWCASDDPNLLPSVVSHANAKTPPALVPCKEADALSGSSGMGSQPRGLRVPESINSNSGIVPALSWQILAGILCFACLAHSVGLMAADLWSPFTLDLDIDHNDQPHRRAVYLNIGTSVLAAMAFITAYPLLRVHHYFYVPPGSMAAAIALLVCSALVCLSTTSKTWRYFYHPKCRTYTFFHVVSLAALFGIVILWVVVCGSDTLHGYPNFAGLYYSFRCIRPLSGVSPICPILLVLLAWYLWAVYQTARLRFSHVHRPRLPRLVVSDSSGQGDIAPYPMFVPDNALEACEQRRSNCLYADITSLLITREIVVRFLKSSLFLPRGNREGKRVESRRWLDILLASVYLFLFFSCLVLFRIHSLDRFVFAPVLLTWGPTLYEGILKALFFPLLMVALSGWLRVLFIWAAINRGLLEPLERMPIRFAFDRYKSGGWMSMLRQKGLHIRWRDMSRSTEAIRQIVNHPDLEKDPLLKAKLTTQYQSINLQIHNLMDSIHKGHGTSKETASDGTHADESIVMPCPSESLWDMPAECADVCSIVHIESHYAEFGTVLIHQYLQERWEKRLPAIDHPAKDPKKDIPADVPGGSASLEGLAEDFIVIRYVALIRAVLLNLRYQMLIVATTFVLALVAWNSFPFQPHAYLDWGFTFLLCALGAGFLGVFAEMHRSAILSRITDTTPNELGWDFYLRIVTFGAVPVLTWIAYQFPQIGGTLYKFLQPGLHVVK